MMPNIGVATWGAGAPPPGLEHQANLLSLQADKT